MRVISFLGVTPQFSENSTPAGDDMARPYYTDADTYLTMDCVTNNSNSAPLANYMHLLPIIPFATRTFTKIATRITTAAAAGKVFRMGIYNANQSTSQPTTNLIDSGDIAADATGVKTYTFSQSLTAGTLYYLAYSSDGAPSIPAVLPLPVGGAAINAGAANPSGGLMRSRTHAAFGDETAQTTYIPSGNVYIYLPLVGIR